MIKCTCCKQVKPENEYYKNKDKRNGRASECKICVIGYTKKYYSKNSERIKKYSREWYQRNKDRQLKLRVDYRRKALSGWEGFIPAVTQCQMCGEEIYFNTTNQFTAINFDHRNGGGEPIEGSPSAWLKANKRTPANEKIWNECNFGMLCYECNWRLPTKNRQSFLENATKYIKGE